MQNKTLLSFWFPKLLAAGLPVPKTKIVMMPEGAAEVVWKLFDGDDGSEEAVKLFESFLDDLRAAADEIGYPVFLRTGLTSHKHDWRNACFVENPTDLGQHVFNIAEFSECASLMGLPWNEWVVREMLPTVKFGKCPRYGDMPVAREFRCFVDGGSIVCVHPYWPIGALNDGGWPKDFDYTALCDPGEDDAEIRRLAARAGAVLGGAWSVDVCETIDRGWFITDLAEASKSFHWKGCVNSDRFADRDNHDD